MMNASSPAAPLDPNGKGLGAFPESCTTAGVAALRWNLLREDVSLPVAVLYEARVRHNLQWMQRFMEAYQVKLAPHGKTTMSPALLSARSTTAPGASRWPPRRRSWPRTGTASARS